VGTWADAGAFRQQATFALKIGQMSGIVDTGIYSWHNRRIQIQCLPLNIHRTDSGVHCILRTPVPEKNTVTCLHLLCKHTGSRNPVSRRTNKQITISKEEAIQELQGIMEGLTPENFAQKSFERSDCGSFQNGTLLSLSCPLAYRFSLVVVLDARRWRPWRVVTWADAGAFRTSHVRPRDRPDERRG
jgi:hypothetical protein